MCLCAILLSLSCSGEERGAECCENDNDLPFRIERLEFHGKMSESYLFTINMLLRIRLLLQFYVQHFILESCGTSA